MSDERALTIIQPSVMEALLGTNNAWMLERIYTCRFMPLGTSYRLSILSLSLSLSL
jgi:hypothetical protein